MHNPTGALDSGRGSNGGANSFFDNTGAVAGTFVAVGLVAVGIVAALGLLCFRRRRRQRLDREVTAAAVAASHGHQRSPIDDADDLHSSTGGPTTSESYPSTVNHPMQQYGQYGATYAAAGGYDPYAQHGQGGYEQQPYSDHDGQNGPFATPIGYDPYANSSGYHDNQYSNEYANGSNSHEYAGEDYNHGNANGAGYGNLQQGQQGYYFDPRDAGQYADAEPQHSGVGQARGSGYDDAYGGYSGGEGSLDTPVHERGDPLHVSDTGSRWSE